jgi:hypothetical protein
MENDVVDHVSLWNKTTSQVTVGDQLKVAGMTGLIAVAVPAIVSGIAIGGCTLWEKFQSHRKNNKSEIESEV